MPAKRSIARGAIEGDASLDSVEDECIALGLRDTDVGLGVDLEIDCAAVAKLATDDVAGALPAAFVGEQRMVDDNPEFVIGKVDRPAIFVPRSPRMGTDQDDAFYLARLGCLHLTWIEEASQDARDPFDLALLAPDEMADARHYDFARVNVVRWGGHGKLAQRRSARCRADVQAVSAGPPMRRSATARPRWPNLHDAWQDYPRDDRQSLHPATMFMPESRSPGKLPVASLSARCIFQFGDAFGTDLMDDPPQLLDARTKPGQLFFADSVMF